MDVRAIIVVGGDPAENTFANTPTVLFDVLGRPVLRRILDRLKASGIGDISVVSEHPCPGPVFSDVRWHCSTGAPPWRLAQRVFTDLSHGATDVILLFRAGCYAEIDYGQLLQFHVDQGSRLTAVVEPCSEMTGTFALNAARRNEAAYLLRHRLRTSRLPNAFFEFSGYINPLKGASSLRRLAIDSFCGNCELQPFGVEIRPGIWVSPSARVHKRARLLAPAFVGRHAKVRASAVVTRCSSIEHHSEVDCGTVVENTTLLPNTYLGAGLDVAHAVVGLKRLAHLGREVEIDVFDSKLVDTVSTSPLRVLGKFASLTAFLPSQVVRGLATGGKSRKRSALGEVPEPKLQTDLDLETQEENLLVVRRYGNE